MKKGDSLQLSYAWWDKNKPPALKSTGLGAALKEYEKNKNRHGLALEALLKVDAARKKGITYCIGPAFADTKAALQRGDAISKAAAKHQKALGESLDELEENIRALRTLVLASQRLFNDYDQAQDPQAQNKALKEININTQYVSDNLNDAVEVISAFTKQQAVLKQYPDIWNRFTNAKTILDGMKDDARGVIGQTNRLN